MLSLTRYVCRTVQLLAHSNESSFQRSEQFVFIVFMELSDSIDSNGNVFTEAPVSKVIFIHSIRFGPSENELAEVVIRLFRIFVSSNRTPVFISLFVTPVIIPFIIIPLIVPGKISGTDVYRFPELPSLTPISSFHDLRDQLSMFCPCVHLWHLGSHF